MRATLGEQMRGPAGHAHEVIVTEVDRADHHATVTNWFLTCAGQSPAWDRYLLCVIHLRAIPGAGPAVIRIPGATHELVLAALDPDAEPAPSRPGTWHFLRPINVQEQLVLPADDAARELARAAARAVVDGVLPAEPALSGAVEPWRTTLIKTSAHFRGEEHAP